MCINPASVETTDLLHEDDKTTATLTLPILYVLTEAAVSAESFKETALIKMKIQ